MTRSLHACIMDFRALRHALALLLFAGTAVAGDAAATTYRIVALTIPADAKYGDAFDVNATGDVVGITAVDNELRIVEWSPPDYAMRILPLPDEDIFTLESAAINDAGDILGFGIARGADGNDLNLNMLWKSDGSFVRLAVDTQRGLGTDAEVRDLNNKGVVVGMVFGPRDALPAVWSKTGKLLPVGIAPLGSEAIAVNDSGMVAGTGYGGSHFFKHAFRWTPGNGVLDLGDLAGGSGWSGTSDVNDSGQIVGYSTVSNPTPENQRAVLWEADNSIHDLGHLPDGAGNQGYVAYRINNLGLVLGNGDSKNWLWTAGTGMVSIDSMIDPNDPLRGYGGIDMHALNDAGVVVGALVNYIDGTIPVMLVPQP